MAARGAIALLCAVSTLALFTATANPAYAWEQQYRFPIKVRVSDGDSPETRVGDIGTGGGIRSGAGRLSPADWDSAAGQARRPILCPKRGFTVALGLRPFFSSMNGATKVVSRGGEGTFLNLAGHLRVPGEKTQWEFYGFMRVWDKVTLRIEYLPWNWNGSGHMAIDGNFGGLMLKRDDSIHTDLGITTIGLGADYDVNFGRDLVFGPNADLYVLRWSERVGKDQGDAMDYTQTIVQPAIGAHLRYEPTNTGYFSWFKPYLEGRFNWMSFGSLGTSGWDLSAGAAPPITRNVDATLKLGYKQWKFEGNRGRLFADVGVEGLYLDFGLQF